MKTIKTNEMRLNAIKKALKEQNTPKHLADKIIAMYSKPETVKKPVELRSKFYDGERLSSY